MDLREIELGVTGGIYVYPAQERSQWRPLVDMVVNLQVS
jgi:hypothetical protein